LLNRLISVTEAVCGKPKDFDARSLSVLSHHDALIDLLLAIYDECSSSTSFSKDKHLANFIAKYAGCVDELRKRRVSVSDFDIMGVIGRGHFGEVHVVREKSSDSVFAMKVMKKDEILKQSDTAFFQEERDIMAWTTSPWLTSLAYSFMDSKSLYLVMEFHPGGDLLTVMEKDDSGDILTGEGVKFYMAEIAAALNDLHQLGFVHRDVKPDNVLITVSGHIKLVDFGSAARLKDGVVENAALPVGTPEYIAPEVLTSLNATPQQGTAGCYGVCCDWWSLGIIGYELLAGVTPFEGDSTAATYGNIMSFNNHLQFPEDVGFSDYFRDLLCRLLSPQNARIQFEEIKKHAFFNGLPWNHLFAMPPPHVPKVTGVDDMSNFEPPSPPKKSRLRTAPKTPQSQLGFSGRELPFVGFTFSQITHTEGRSKRLSVTDGTHFRRSVSCDLLSETPLETSEVELSSMIAEVKQILQSREEALSKVEESHKVLQEDRIMKQSELEELQRALDMERSERQSAEAKTLQLLAEVREFHEKIVKLKEAKAKENISQYQKALVLAESEKKDAAVKVSRLQEALNRQVKETEKSDVKVSQMLKKMSELKESKRKELVSMQNKIVQTFKESETTVKDLELKLEKALQQNEELTKQLAQLQHGAVSGGHSEGKEGAQEGGHVMAVDELKESLSHAEKELIVLMTSLNESVTELSTTKELLAAAKVENNSLKQKLEYMENKSKEKAVAEQETLDKLCTTMSALEEKDKQVNKLESLLLKEREEKERGIQAHQEALSTLEEKKKSLEVKLEHLEVLQEKAREDHTDETRITELEGENLQLKQQRSQHNLRVQKDAELLSKGQENLVSLQGQLVSLKESSQNKERVLVKEVQAKDQALKEAGEKAVLLERERDSLKQRVEGLMGELKVAKSKDNTTLIEELKKSKSSSEQKVADLTADLMVIAFSLERRVSLLKEVRSTSAGELQKARDRITQLEQAMDTQKLNNEVLGDQLNSAEGQIEDLKMALSKVEEDKLKWMETKRTLESDLEIAGSRLEETATLLDTERSLRVEVEEQNVRSLELFQRSSSVHSEEIKRYQQNLFSQKQLAEGYSRRITELEQANSLLKSKCEEVESKSERMSAELSASQKEASETRLNLNKLKASYLKLSQESASKAAEIESMTVADQEREQQLRALLVDKEEQEYRMKTTIEQQSKLITHAMHSRTPPKESKLKKGLRKLIPRSRNPEKEVEEWKELTGMLKKSSSYGNSPLTSASDRLKRRRWLSPDSSNPIVSVHLSGDSVSQTTPRQKSPRNVKSMYIQSSVSDCNIVDSSGIREEGGMREGDGGEDGSSNVASRSQLSLVLHHNIPHKFNPLPPMRSLVAGKCAHCELALSRKRKMEQCIHCKIRCHPECSRKIPNNCGLPVEMLASGSTPPPKKAKYQVISQSSSSSPSPLMQGQLMVFRSHAKQQKSTAMWAVLTEFHLKIFTTELAARREHPVVCVSFCDPRNPVSLTASIIDLPSSVKGPKENVLLLQHGKMLSQDIYLTTQSEADKNQWTSSLNKVIPTSGLVRDLSLELKPIDLSARSSLTDLSIYSDMFADL
jgi:citron Rho-interacting kinase